MKGIKGAPSHSHVPGRFMEKHRDDCRLCFEHFANKCHCGAVATFLIISEYEGLRADRRHAVCDGHLADIARDMNKPGWRLRLLVEPQLKGSE